MKQHRYECVVTNDKMCITHALLSVLLPEVVVYRQTDTLSKNDDPGLQRQGKRVHVASYMYVLV